MYQIRMYNISESIVFHKITAGYGGLSNMADGYSLNINDVIIPAAEQLYQSCRFPGNPELQFAIITEPNPIKAKLIGRRHLNEIRKDWDFVKFKIMQWVLEVKLYQNRECFGELLKSTGNKQIVKLDSKNKLWGATKEKDQLIGANLLGCILMQLRREFVLPGIQQKSILPPAVPGFLFLGHKVETVCNDNYFEEIRWSRSNDVINE